MLLSPDHPLNCLEMSITQADNCHQHKLSSFGGTEQRTDTVFCEGVKVPSRHAE